MNGKTSKLINTERVTQLFECYGANPKAWPEDERATALALINHSDELQQLQQEAEQLDRFLVLGQEKLINDSISPELVGKIVGNLPPQDKPGRWSRYASNVFISKPYASSGNLLGMIAASLAVIVISFAIVELHPSSTVSPQQNRLTQQELDNWMWDQISADSASDDDEPMTIMSFLEM